MNTFRHSLFRHTWGCVGVAGCSEAPWVQKTVFWGGVKMCKNRSKMVVFGTPPRRTNN